MINGRTAESPPLIAMARSRCEVDADPSGDVTPIGPNIGKVPDFKSEWWPPSNRNGGPASNRNDGRLHLGMGGRLKSKFAQRSWSLPIFSRPCQPFPNVGHFLTNMSDRPRPLSAKQTRTSERSLDLAHWEYRCRYVWHIAHGSQPSRSPF